MAMNQWHLLITPTFYTLFLYYQGWPGNSQYGKKKKNGASDPNLLTFELSYRSSRTVFEVIGTKFWSYNKDMVREEKIIKLRFFKMCYIT